MWQAAILPGCRAVKARIGYCRIHTGDLKAGFDSSSRGLTVGIVREPRNSRHGAAVTRYPTPTATADHLLLTWMDPCRVWGALDAHVQRVGLKMPTPLDVSASFRGARS